MFLSKNPKKFFLKNLARFVECLDFAQLHNRILQHIFGIKFVCLKSNYV